jgi:hypothetical protein
MKDRMLVVVNKQNGWSVRLDGVEVVRFFGSHAEEWAFRECEELTHLLDAQLCSNLPDRHDGPHLFAIPG